MTTTADAPSNDGTGESLEGTPMGPVLEQLREDLEAFGLSNYESRVLLALVQLGSAPPSHVAQTAGLGRTNVYRVLESLHAKGLAEPVPGKAGMWASVGREEVFRLLYGAEEQRLRQLRVRRERAEAAMAELGPEASKAYPYMHPLRGADEVNSVFHRMLAEAKFDFAMFTRPPYSYVPGQPNPAVLDMLARGVNTRVVYEASMITDPEATHARALHESYHAAGAEGRVVDELPVKLTVIDRRMVLLVTTHPTVPEVGFPASLLVEHPGVASFALDAFECQWAKAQPYKEAKARYLSEATK